jgi:hypothetical protein
VAERPGRLVWGLVGTTGAAIGALTVLTVVGGPAPLVLGLQVVLIASFAALAIVDLRVAVAIAMLELAVAGASGQWTRLPGGVSGRITLDLIVAAVAAARLAIAWRRTGRLELGRYGPHALALAIVIPAVWIPLGFVNGNRPSDVLADGNAHLFFAFTLAFIVLIRAGHGAWLRHWFAVSCWANGIVTFVLILISATGLVDLDTTMRHILTDKLLAGNVVGYQPNGAYRLFLASGLYLQLGLGLTTWRLLQAPRDLRWWALYGILLVDVAATYTRGFWAGTVLAIGIVLILGSRGWRRPTIVVAGSAGVVLLATLVLLPVGFSVPNYLLQRTASIGAGLGDRPTASPDPNADPEQDISGAVSNQVRVVQARVLLGHIAERPILGHGFGTIARDYPYDQIYSYELAYLDLTYKSGIVGLLLFLSYPVRLLVDAVRIRFGGLDPPDGVDRRELAIVISVILSIAATGATNPYFLAAFGLMPILVMIAWLDTLARPERRGTG